MCVCVCVAHPAAGVNEAFVCARVRVCEKVDGRREVSKKNKVIVLHIEDNRDGAERVEARNVQHVL